MVRNPWALYIPGNNYMKDYCQSNKRAGSSKIKTLTEQSGWGRGGGGEPVKVF